MGLTEPLKHASISEKGIVIMKWELQCHKESSLEVFVFSDPDHLGEDSLVLCFSIICKETIIKCKDGSLLLLISGISLVHFLYRGECGGW